MTAAGVETMLSGERFGCGDRLATDAALVEGGLIRLIDRLTGITLPPSAHAGSIDRRVLLAGTFAETFLLLDSGRSPETGALTTVACQTAELLAANPPRPGPSVAGHELLCPEAAAPAILAVILARANENLAASSARDRLEILPVPDVARRRLAGALDLLGRAVPRLAGATLPAVPGIALIGGDRIESAFLATTPSLIYLNLAVHRDPAALADAILHEALHQKLAHTRLVHRLLRPGFDDFADLPVPVPWGDRGFRWFSLGRALAAAHVYLHLALLHLRMIETGATAGLDRQELRRRLVVRSGRARYLLAALGSAQFRAELGADAVPYLAWLEEAAADLAVVGLDGRPLEDWGEELLR